MPKSKKPELRGRCFRCDGRGQTCAVCGETDPVGPHQNNDVNDHPFKPETCEDCGGNGK